MPASSPSKQIAIVGAGICGLCTALGLAKQGHKVTVYERDDPLPDGVVRPSKFGIKIALCQWTTLARRWGWIVGAMAEDISCTPCLAAFGFKELKDKSDFAQFAMDMGYFDSLEPASVLVE